MAPDATPTPLIRKLGIRPGSRVTVSGAPASFPATLGELPPGATLSTRAGRSRDVIVIFATRLADLERRVPRLMPSLAVDGGLWLCYPKRASGVATDLDFAIVQRIGLEAGLVDNKSAAVDDTWSGVRFVVRLADRPSWRPAPPIRPQAGPSRSSRMAAMNAGDRGPMTSRTTVPSPSTK